MVNLDLLDEKNTPASAYQRLRHNNDAINMSLRLLQLSEYLHLKN